MAQPNDAPLELTVNQDAFEFMQDFSEETFGKPVDELSFYEASRLIGGVLVEAAQGYSFGEGRTNDQTVVDSTEDGKEAFVGYVRQLAGEIDSQIDNEQEIVLHITRNPTLWELIRSRSRKPRTAQTYRFLNEPPQHP